MYLTDCLFFQGRHDDAIAGCHKALGLKPDDPFAAEMLNKALLVTMGWDGMG